MIEAGALLAAIGIALAVVGLVIGVEFLRQMRVPRHRHELVAVFREHRVVASFKRLMESTAAAPYFQNEDTDG